MTCYRYVYYTSECPIFSEVDTAVVLIMESSTQEERLLSQFRQYPICRNIIFQYNRGFRKCPKKCVSTTTEDILHAVCQACRHVPEKPILILEDDAVFRPQLITHARYVDEFLRTPSWDLYSLGSNPLVCLPTLGRHVRVPIMGGAHAVFISAELSTKLQSKKYLQQIRSRMSKYGCVKDVSLSSLARSYMYKVPLAVQPHPITDNARLWMNPIFKVFIKLTNAERDGRRLYDMCHATRFIGGCIPTAFIVGFLVVYIGLQIARASARNNDSQYS